MEEFVNDVSPDSSPASTEGANTAPDTSVQDSAPNPQPRGFHEHPDWQRMVASRREDRQVISQLSQQLDAIRRQQESARSQGQFTDQERQQFTEAATQLKRLLAFDPQLAQVLRMAQRGPEFDQQFQAFQQSQQQATAAHYNATRSAIKEMATDAGLKTDPVSLKRIVKLVAGEAMDIENGPQRFAQGDMSVIEEAFNAMKPWLNELRQPATNALAKTKNQTKGLPPAPSKTGSTAGAPAKKSLKETGDARKFEADMHQQAKDMLLRLSEG